MKGMTHDVIAISFSPIRVVTKTAGLFVLLDPMMLCLIGETRGSLDTGHRFPQLAAGLHQLVNPSGADTEHGFSCLAHTGDHHVSD